MNAKEHNKSMVAMMLRIPGELEAIRAIAPIRILRGLSIEGVADACEQIPAMLREYIEQTGKTQKEVSEEVGIDPGFFSRILNGLSGTPCISTICKLQRVVEVGGIKQELLFMAEIDIHAAGWFDALTNPEMIAIKERLSSHHNCIFVPDDTFDKRTVRQKEDKYIAAEQRFSYDEETGVFTGGTGKVVGHLNGQGYITLSTPLGGKYFGLQAHRLAWYITTGEVPNVVDHINGDRSDNRICNLRNVTSRENASNRVDSREHTGIRSDMGLHEVTICKEGRPFRLGRFRHLHEALKVRRDAECMSITQLEAFTVVALKKQSNTGMKGICQRGRKFVVQKSMPKSLFGVYGRKIHIGTYDDMDDAIFERDRAYAEFDSGIHPISGEPLEATQ